jgi:hypothetical protein
MPESYEFFDGEEISLVILEFCCRFLEKGFPSSI